MEVIWISLAAYTPLFCTESLYNPREVQPKRIHKLSLIQSLVQLKGASYMSRELHLPLLPTDSAAKVDPCREHMRLKILLYLRGSCITRSISQFSSHPTKPRL